LTFITAPTRRKTLQREEGPTKKTVLKYKRATSGSVSIQLEV